MRNFIILILFTLFFTGQSYGIGSNPKKAAEFGEKAMKMFDEGKEKNAVVYLDSAIITDPGNISYVYEKSVAYFKLKDYPGAIRILDTLVKRPDAKEIFFQLLGNCYVYKNSYDGAMEAFKAGLKRFPDSGGLYFDIGNLNYSAGIYRTARQYWEEGIKAAPLYMSIYYGLIKNYEETRAYLWPVIYGEIYLNYSTSLKRNTIISRKLFEFYNKALIPLQDTLVVKFNSTSYPMIQYYDRHNEYTFDQMFQMIMYVSARKYYTNNNSELNINKLISIRKDFIDNWFKYKMNKKFPNILFDWERKIIKKGYFTAYNYWLMSEAKRKEFESWVKKHSDDFKVFLDWMKNNSMGLNKHNCIYNGKYAAAK